ncbi:MAG: hypothetical protein R3C55_09180 [Parvularculaceae bacterium]
MSSRSKTARAPSGDTIADGSLAFASDVLQIAVFASHSKALAPIVKAMALSPFL